MKKRKVDPWFPFWIDKWLHGSTVIELKPDERGIFVSLMALSKKDDGWVRANEGVPYLETQLCGLFNCKPELLRRTIKRCMEVGKIRMEKDGTFYMTSHENYKLSARHERRVESEGSYEKILTEKIIKELDFYSPPIQHETQKLLKNGRIDIFIPEPYIAIIELKNSSSADNIQRAIGQLLIYKNEYPEAMLFIATPERMHKKTLDKMAGFKIQQWDLKSMFLEYDVRNPDATSQKGDANIKKNILNNNKNKKKKKEEEEPLPQHKRIKFSFKKEEWQGILIEDKSQWKAGCPDVDIEKQLYKMKNWLIANPNKAKKNYAQFIVNWLNSEQGKIDAKSRYSETDKKDIKDWIKEPVEKEGKK